MRRFLCAVSAAIVLMAPATGLAEEAKTADGKPSPEVRKLLADVEENFSRGDAKGLAACWTPSGDFTGPAGERVEGRDNIEKAFRGFFAGRKDLQMKLRPSSFRAVNEGLALVDAVAEVKPAAGAAADEAVLSLVLVKRDDQWQIESARETVGRKPSRAPQLQDLESMVGDWASEASSPDGLSFHSTCDWTANRAFLIRKFKVEMKNVVSRGGTEVIGWDPRTRRVRSWVFDSDGGFGENVWVRDGNRWLIQCSGTLADGSEMSSTSVIALVDPNTMTIESKDRIANGERLPDIPQTTIKRQLPAKDEAKAKAPEEPPQRVLP